MPESKYGNQPPGHFEADGRARPGQYFCTLRPYRHSLTAAHAFYRWAPTNSSNDRGIQSLNIDFSDRGSNGLCSNAWPARYLAHASETRRPSIFAPARFWADVKLSRNAAILDQLPGREMPLLSCHCPRLHLPIAPEPLPCHSPDLVQKRSSIHRSDQAVRFVVYSSSFLMYLAPLQPKPVAPGTCARSALRFFFFNY